MIRYEWKKLLFGRKGLLLIGLFLAAELVGLFFTQPYDSVLEQHRSVYAEYLSHVNGSLTPEKRAYLETEMDRLNTIHQNLEQLKLDYYAGDITEEAYRTNFDVLSVEDARYIGFSKLYSQYIFVREAEERSFLYTGGWEVLLTDWEPDYLFLLLLIMVLTPIFCEEYACRMHEILLTQKRSAKYQVLTKVCVALTLVFVLTAVLQLMDLAYCAVVFGLPDGHYALQSLRSFGDSIRNLTLWQAFWLQFALKELGYLYAAVIILFFAVLLKKFSLTLMSSMAVLILPFLTVDNRDFLSIPGPWALTIGSLYLNSGTELGILLMMVLAILVVMLFVIRRSNTNWQLKGHLCLLAVLALVLTGCGQQEETILYNRAAADQYETDKYLLVTSYDGATMTDKVTGITYDIPLNPAATCENTLYGVGDIVYYLRTTTHYPSAGWDTVETDVDLVELDLETMQESVVYQWNEEPKWFFGLLNRNSLAPDSYTVELLFLHGDTMYYVDASQSTLNRMNLKTGRYELVLQELYSQDIAYDGQNLYYLDSYNRLVIHDLDTDKSQSIDEVVAGEFMLAEEGICFQNRRESGTWCLWIPNSE